MTQTYKSSWDVSNFDNWTYDMLPKGAVVLEAGNSVQYITGGWRSEMPIWTKENCRDCKLCWIHCPDSSIRIINGAAGGIDYDHCKGCGVCFHECKFGALKMVAESSEEARAVKDVFESAAAAATATAATAAADVCCATAAAEAAAADVCCVTTAATVTAANESAADTAGAETNESAAATAPCCCCCAANNAVEKGA